MEGPLVMDDFIFFNEQDASEFKHDNEHYKSYFASYDSKDWFGKSQSEQDLDTTVPSSRLDSSSSLSESLSNAASEESDEADLTSRKRRRCQATFVEDFRVPESTFKSSQRAVWSSQIDRSIDNILHGVQENTSPLLQLNYDDLMYSWSDNSSEKDSKPNTPVPTPTSSVRAHPGHTSNPSTSYPVEAVNMGMPMPHPHLPYPPQYHPHPVPAPHYDHKYPPAGGPGGGVPGPPGHSQQMPKYPRTDMMGKAPHIKQEYCSGPAPQAAMHQMSMHPYVPQGPPPQGRPAQCPPPHLIKVGPSGQMLPCENFNKGWYPPPGHPGQVPHRPQGAASDPHMPPHGGPPPPVPPRMSLPVPGGPGGPPSQVAARSSPVLPAEGERRPEGAHAGQMVQQAPGGGGPGAGADDNMPSFMKRSGLTVEALERLERYKEKRRMRQFTKKIRYPVRKLNAERRPRVKGRFVKQGGKTGEADGDEDDDEDEDDEDGEEEETSL